MVIARFQAMYLRKLYNNHRDKYMIQIDYYTAFLIPALISARVDCISQSPTGETRHIQQIYIDEPTMYHYPKFVYLKRGFLHSCNNSTSY